MVNTNSKEFREKFRRHILSFYKGRGGYTGFVNEVNHYLRNQTFGPRTNLVVVMENLWNAPTFLWKSYDIERYMKRLGFTDEKRMEKFHNQYGYGYDALYRALIVKEGVWLYENYMKKHKLVQRRS